jgi:hypothetical protein
VAAVGKSLSFNVWVVLQHFLFLGGATHMRYGEVGMVDEEGTKPGLLVDKIKGTFFPDIQGNDRQGI